MNLIRILSAAADELSQCVMSYESVRDGLGERFRSEFEKIHHNLTTAVAPGSNYTRRTKVSRMRRFPYGVVFVQKRDVITIIAIAHLSRQVGYWSDRLKQVDLP